MKTLKEHLKNIITPNIIDCHCHLFDANGRTPLNHNIKKVGFMDIWFKELNRYTGNQSEFLYDKYIKEGLPSGIKLCATAPDPDQIIHIYEKYTPYIKGFGELKCYDYTFSSETPQKLDFKDLKWVDELCKYNIMNLPIYIHYSLDENNYNYLEELFKKYPNIPFILCHAGVGTPDEYGFSLEGNQMGSFKLANNLSKLSNVYLDISYTVSDWIYDIFPNLRLFNEEPYNIQKYLLGTDVNNQQFMSKNVDGNELYHKQEKIFLNLYKDIGIWNYFNYKKIFE